MSALLRVAELNAAYAATIDADRLEAWPDFFVDNCLYKITSADNHRRGYSAGIVYADSRAMLRDRVTALRSANIYERQSYRRRALRPRRPFSCCAPSATDARICLRPASILIALPTKAATSSSRNGS